MTTARARARRGAATAMVVGMAAAFNSGVADGPRVLLAQAQQAVVADPDGLEVVQLRPNLFMIAGAGGNIAVQVGDDGPIVVDTGSEAKADAVAARIKRLSEHPLRFVINTSADVDHVGGNLAVSRAGQTLLAIGVGVGGTSEAVNAFTNGGAAAIVAADEVIARMSAPSGKAPAFPSAAWPTESFAEMRRPMYFNGEGIEILRQPAAHSDGDSIVFFRRSDVIVAGDVLDTTRFPVIDVDKGGTIQGELDALNRLVDMAIASVPLVSRDAGTLVIPGHGRVYDHFDLVDYRDMVTVIRDRIRDLADAGLTLDQVKATSPARGWTRQFGATTGPWTTDMFVEAIYKTLPREKKQ